MSDKRDYHRGLGDRTGRFTCWMLTSCIGYSACLTQSCVQPHGPRSITAVETIEMLHYGWQFDSKLWAQIPSDLRHSDAWSKVGFVENESALLPADQSGIYMLCTSPVACRMPHRVRSNHLFSNLLTPIYIGKTDNLRRRFLEHCRRPSVRLTAARRCFGASMDFWYHRMAPERLAGDEAILIQCFGPTANERRESLMGIVGNPIPIGVHDRQPIPRRRN